MNDADCWDVLGLAATDDVAAIRRAYAARLKAIDVDRDAAGFQALRAARDEATWFARHDREQDEPKESAPAPSDEILWGVGDLAAELDAEPAPEPVPVSAEDDMRDEPYHRLYHLLDPDDHERERDVPDAESAAAQVAAFDAIVADPRMEQIDFYGHQEQWLATVIALAWPTSEPLVERAVARFGWTARHGLLGEDRATEFVVQRANAIRFEAQVSHPHHRYNNEWRELTKPATTRSWRNLFLDRTSVANLLERIRGEFPTLERRLDPRRVEMWQQAIDAKAKKKSYWIVVLVIIFANVAIHAPWREIAGRPAETELVSSDPRAAMSLALTARGFPDVDLSAMQRQSPALFAQLHAAAVTARQNRTTISAFNVDVAPMLNAHIDAVLRNMPAELLTDFAKAVLHQARTARDVNWEKCVKRLFGPNAQAGLSAAELREMDRLYARTLTLPRPAARPASGDTMKLEPDVSRAILQRSGMTPGERYSKALMNEGTAQDRCTVRIAAIDVALDQPARRREELLRALVGQ